MDKVDLYCQVTREKLLTQDSQNREFGAKASSMLGFGAAMIGFGAIILNLSGDDGAGGWILLIFIMLILAFLVTACCGLFVLWTRDWGNGPTVKSLAKTLDSDADSEYARAVGDAYGKSVDDNWCVLDRKATALRWGVAALALESLMVAILGAILGLS